MLAFAAPRPLLRPVVRPGCVSPKLVTSRPFRRDNAFCAPTIAVRRQSRVVAIASPPPPDDDGAGSESGSDADSGEERQRRERFDEGQGLPRPSPASIRAARENDLLERLSRIEVESDEPSEEGKKRAERYLSRETQLLYVVRQLAKDLTFDVNGFLNKPVRLLVAASLAILFGFFAATSATTIIGSVADWDPLAAAVLLVYVESFTRFYYRSTDRSIVLRLANAFKVGLIYGCVVDCIKLGS
jgi:Protein of unknown function (DUF565)